MKVQEAQQALWTGGPILLIEDEPSVSAFLRAALERKGYAVENASSGAEGLQRLSNGRYAGVISDIHAGSRERSGSARLDSEEPAGIEVAHHFDQRGHGKQ